MIQINKAESDFLGNGGYRLLVLFKRGVPKSKTSLIKINHIPEELLIEALKLKLIKKTNNKKDDIDEYFSITVRGREVRDN